MTNQNNIQYWLGGTVWGKKSQLERFTKESEPTIWEHNKDREELRSEKIFAAFEQIKIGDIFAIKKFSRANPKIKLKQHLTIYYIGKVLTIESDKKITLSKNLINKEFQFEPIGQQGNSTLTKVTSEQIIKELNKKIKEKELNQSEEESHEINSLEELNSFEERIITPNLQKVNMTTQTDFEERFENYILKIKSKLIGKYVYNIKEATTEAQISKIILHSLGKVQYYNFEKYNNEAKIIIVTKSKPSKKQITFLNSLCICYLYEIEENHFTGNIFKNI